MSRFIQIHWLASYPATLLNRDDAGLAKRLPFGGATRGRISSQCLKRRWRLAGTDSLEKARANPWALQNVDFADSVRSKAVVDNRIKPRLIAEAGGDNDVIAAVCDRLNQVIYGGKGSDKKSRQALLLGEAEIEYLAQKAQAAIAGNDAETVVKALDASLTDEKKNIKALVGGGGLIAALFGRMVTSDVAANTDAAIHVAHALTVHPLERELDFMTAVDDLKRREEGDDSGAAGVFDMELASGLYYGYVVVDVPLLISNLSNDTDIAARVVTHLIHLIAEVSPGAKKGSTAPYAYAQWMLVEQGDRQPRTLVNSFHQPLPDSRASAPEAVSKLAEHLAGLDNAYGSAESRRQMAVEEGLEGVERGNLDELAKWAAAGIQA